MSANDRQVGGTHYISDFQHWDLMDDYNIPYLAGCATKYLTRWRKSPKEKGIQDLEKSQHYTEKLYEKSLTGRRNYANTIPLSIMDKFIKENNLELERTPLQFILCWPNPDSYRQAIEFIRQLLIKAQDKPAPGDIAQHHRARYEEPNYPGTPDDGGHYERNPDG
jgi:hypothetical protein